MVNKLFHKEAPGSSVKSEILLNQQLPEELLKLIIRNIENWKINSSFTRNNWGDDFADIQLLSKCNKEVRFSMCYWCLQ